LARIRDYNPKFARKSAKKREKARKSAKKREKARKSAKKREKARLKSCY
jgi:hypothetical protein